MPEYGELLDHLRDQPRGEPHALKGTAITQRPDSADIVIMEVSSGIPLLTFTPHGVITLRVGGYYTIKHLAALNYWLPEHWRVLSQDRIWSLHMWATTARDRSIRRWVFGDGMELFDSGRVRVEIASNLLSLHVACRHWARATHQAPHDPERPVFDADIWQYRKATLDAIKAGLTIPMLAGYCLYPTTRSLLKAARIYLATATEKEFKERWLRLR